MNIYFTTSGKFYKEYRKLYDKIIDTLTKLTGEKPYIALGDIDYEKASEKEITNAVKRMVKQLHNADIVITDNTFSVAGVGYDVATAINLKKPVLVLKLKSKTKPGPHTLNTLENRLLTYTEYTEEKLEEILNNFLKSAKEKLDTKFILIISPEIDRYLEWAGKNRRMHKAQIVRNAVEKELKTDEDYKAHLKQQEK
jgi:predicted DNA-binding protein